jgi:hypothetical protein
MTRLEAPRRIYPRLLTSGAVVLVLITLIFHEWSFGLYPSLVNEVYVARWVPITSGVLLAATLVLGAARGWRSPLAVGALALAVVYWLSLRELVFNPQSAELQTTWLGYPTSSITLNDVNDRPYCYRQTLFTIKLTQHGPNPASTAYFRGVWPSVLQPGKLIFESCSD